MNSKNSNSKAKTVTEKKVFSPGKTYKQLTSSINTAATVHMNVIANFRGLVLFGMMLFTFIFPEYGAGKLFFEISTVIRVSGYVLWSGFMAIVAHNMAHIELAIAKMLPVFHLAGSGGLIVGILMIAAVQAEYISIALDVQNLTGGNWIAYSAMTISLLPLAMGLIEGFAIRTQVESEDTNELTIVSEKKSEPTEIAELTELKSEGEKLFQTHHKSFGLSKMDINELKACYGDWFPTFEIWLDTGNTNWQSLADKTYDRNCGWSAPHRQIPPIYEHWIAVKDAETKILHTEDGKVTAIEFSKTGGGALVPESKKTSAKISDEVLEVHHSKAVNGTKMNGTPTHLSHAGTEVNF